MLEKRSFLLYPIFIFYQEMLLWVYLSGADTGVFKQSAKNEHGTPLFIKKIKKVNISCRSLYW